MNASKWQKCSSPESMLLFLRGKVTDRKLRLFFCACARRVWTLFADDSSRHAVEVAERYADGLASLADLAAARAAALLVAEQPPPSDDPPSWYSAWLAVHAASEELPESSVLSASAVVTATVARAFQHRAGGGCRFGRAARAWERRLYRREWETEVGLLRDIIGNPFRPLRMDANSLAWNAGTVVRLAKAIYEERRFEDLPVLADALEEAGCRDEELLSHCRGPGPHTRGCFVVDSLLGKS